MSDYKPEQEYVLELSGLCKIVATDWNWGKEVCLEYIERSPDRWHSDAETSIDIDKEMAQNIVGFLKKHFEI